MFNTIRSKIIFFTILFILLVIFVPSLFLASQFEKNFEERSLQMLDITTDIVMTGLKLNMIKGQHQDIQATINELSLNNSISHIRLFCGNGRIAYASDTTEIGKNIFDRFQEIPVVLLSEAETVKQISENIYTTWQAIPNDPECQACHTGVKNICYMGIESHYTQAERFFYTGSRHIYFLGIAVILILIGGYYLVLQYFLSKPFSRFIKALNEVKKGNLDITLPAKKRDEIGAIEKHFNRMTGEMKRSREKIEALHNEQIQRADKLVTLGELAAEMAHEINNPAAIIMSRADYLEMESADNAELKKYNQDLEVIIRQTEKISNITGNILKYSKKLPKNYALIDPIAVIEESLVLLQHRLIKKHIRIIKEIDNANYSVYGDALQLEQVFTNILNNAIDAIGTEGTIKITVYKEAKKIYLMFSDDGPGIDDEVIDNIFAPFFTTKDAQKGTGIGLYVVRNIIKNHNAEIECSSIRGKGTEFLITFNSAEQNG